MYGGKIRDKRRGILEFVRNNPSWKAADVARHFETSPSYVYRVKSEAGLTRGYRKARRSRGKIGCGQGVATNLTWVGGRGAHGRSFFKLTEVLPVGWVGELDSGVFVLVNRWAGRRQCGFKDAGDPCSCQIYERTGTVNVFPRRPDWRLWLVKKFVEAGWDRDRAEFVVGSLDFSWKVREFVIPWPRSAMPPRGFRARAAFLTLKHNGSDPDHIEAELRVDQLVKDLGIPEILGQIDVLTKGQATLYQEFRRWTAFATLLAQRLTGALDQLGVKDAEKEGSVAERHPTKEVQGRPVYEKFFPLKWRETSPALSRDSNPGYHGCVEGRDVAVPECMAKECHFKCKLIWTEDL